MKLPLKKFHRAFSTAVSEHTSGAADSYIERVRLLAKEMVPELSDGLRLTAFIAAPMICSFCVRSTILY